MPGAASKSGGILLSSGSNTASISDTQVSAGPAISSTHDPNAGSATAQATKQQKQSRQQQPAKMSSFYHEPFVSAQLSQSTATAMTSSQADVSNSYVVASTDLHQLQQSGGQLLVQAASSPRARQVQLRQEQQLQLPQQDAHLQQQAKRQPQRHVQERQQYQQQQLNQEGNRLPHASDGIKVSQETQHQPANPTYMTQMNTHSAPRKISTTPTPPTTIAVSANAMRIGGPLDRPFKCDKCTASFIEERECEEHRSKHSGDGPFTCEDCHFSFMYKSHFKSHKSRCEKKRATLSLQNSLKPNVVLPPIKREFPTHETVKSACPEDNARRRTSNRTATQRPAKSFSTSIHTPVYPQKRATDEPQYLIQPSFILPHDTEEVTADDPEIFINPNGSVTKSGSKRQIFNAKGKKDPELNTFNPVRPSFKRLKQQNNFGRPFECSECDASFTTNDDLEAHRQKHSSDGPYKCDSCQFLYLYRRLYDAHKRKCKKGRSKKDGPIGSASPFKTQAAPFQISQVESLQMSQGEQQVHFVQQPQQAVHVSNPLQPDQTSGLMLVESPQHGFKTNQGARTVQLLPSSSTSSEQQQLQSLGLTSVGNAILVAGGAQPGTLIDGQLQLQALQGAGVQVSELEFYCIQFLLHYFVHSFFIALFCEFNVLFPFCFYCTILCIRFLLHYFVHSIFSSLFVH